MTRRIAIDPITRLEGHGKIEIFLDDAGAVQDVFFQIPELRGFEEFVVGRPVEELPRIVTRICGVCPASHHLASAKAVDGCFGGEAPQLAHQLREMYYQAHFLHSHIAHFYALAAPDFVCGPTSDPATRNLLGLVSKLGLQIGSRVLEARAQAQRVQQLIGGRSTHLVWCLPGGVSKGLAKAELEEIRPLATKLLEFSRFSLKLFRKLVLENPSYLNLVTKGPYALDLGSMGLVDDDGAVNFYDGRVRVVDAAGKEIVRFEPKDYARVLAEHVEPWSYLKFPFLKDRGWKGFVEGADSSLYLAGPLARLNAAEKMATPEAEQARTELFKAMGGRPCHALMASHWARIVEMLQCAESLVSSCADPGLCGGTFRVVPKAITGEGFGVVEAMRGTLFHHYTCDANGLCTSCNLVVGTTHNNAPIQMATKKVASRVIRPGQEPNEGILNLVEMTFRAFDPCYSCATHSLPGQMPLRVRVHRRGEVWREFRQGGG